MTELLDLEVGKSYLNSEDQIVTIVGITPVDSIMCRQLFTDMRGKNYDPQGLEVRHPNTSDASPVDFLKSEFPQELTYAGSPAAGGILLEVPKITGAESFEAWRVWGNTTFGLTTPAALVARAYAEMEKELVKAADDSNGIWTSDVVEEAADVVLILTRIPGLWEAMERKMTKNHQRQWEKHGDGTGSHIE